MVLLIGMISFTTLAIPMEFEKAKQKTEFVKTDFVKTENVDVFVFENNFASTNYYFKEMNSYCGNDPQISFTSLSNKKTLNKNKYFYCWYRNNSNNSLFNPNLLYQNSLNYNCNSKNYNFLPDISKEIKTINQVPLF